MARGVNKVIIVGNLGGDPEVRHSPNGNAITTMNIATSEGWTDKNTGQKQERTEWHRVTLFNRLGEIAAQYCRKGSQVYIEGSLRTDKYQDKKTGEDRYSTGIIANNMQLLGSRGGDSFNADQNSTHQGHNQSDRYSSGGAASQQASTNAAPPPMAAAAGADFDDDIPF